MIHQNRIFVGLSTFCQLLSNGHTGFGYDYMAGLGFVESFNPESGDSFHKLKQFAETQQDWLFGHFSYDLKNETEQLQSTHPDHIGFPLVHFFRPRFVLLLRGTRLEIGFLPGDEAEAEKIRRSIGQDDPVAAVQVRADIKARVSREEYITRVEQIRKHIARGDIYEMNYCMEFFAEHCRIDPPAVFSALNAVSQAPFSAFYRHGDCWLMSASPERFLKKDGRKIISQPIKGTARRSSDPAEDRALAAALQQNAKERSENIMIVDLVRNDLSHVAERGSVNVDELCGVYSFKQVHQLISTVSARLENESAGIDAVRYAFPMGSMTGAPKVRAMEIIEEMESTRRGLYSGAVGYFTPGGDFDFNVVIRSIQYNAKNEYLSFMVGSAITHASDPAAEYEECSLKAKAMFDVLGSSLR